MMIEAADSTMNSSSASMRSLVLSVKGRKIAKISAFHTQSHLPSAAVGGELERNRFRGHRLSGEFVNVPIA